MANKERTGHFIATASWQNLGALVTAEAQFANMSLLLEELLFLVPAGSPQNVLVALTEFPSSPPTSDAVANTIVIGGSRLFSVLHLHAVWFKVASGTLSVLEFAGKPV